MGRSRRHHYIAQFYLRDFADPLFSDNIYVYRRAKGRWTKMTPRGVGWFPHLYTMFDERGERTDDFERFLGQHVEGPAAPALREAARKPHSLSDEQRKAIALFIGVTAARTPAMMRITWEAYMSRLPTDELRDLDAVVELWRSLNGRGIPDPAKARRDFLTRSALGAILLWAFSMRDRLLQWNWTFLRTTCDKPFVTSDWPAFMQYDDHADIRLVSFPISSEVALIVNSAGTIREERDPLGDVRAMNQQTMDRASHFIVCRQQSFLGDEHLRRWVGQMP